MLHGFDWCSPNQDFNDIGAESPVVTQESMTFWYCVDVFVEKLQCDVFGVFG